MRIAMIPTRIGSTRAKKKNLALIGDKPMMAWAILAAKESQRFDKVIVNGDNQVFANIAKQYGVEYYNRPLHLGSDETLIDDVLLDFIKNNPCDICAIVNTINPLQTSYEVANVIDYFENNNLDSCNTFEERYIHGFLNNVPINFKFEKMQRTQDLEPIQLLSYSVQVVRTKCFLQQQNIFCGKFELFGPISKTAAMIVKTDDDIININNFLSYALQKPY